MKKPWISVPKVVLAAAAVLTVAVGPVRAEVKKTEGTRAEGTKAEVPRPEAPKTEGVKAGEKSEAAKLGETKLEGAKTDATAAPAVEASLEEKWGVRLLPLRLSAGGYMLDFRYRVLDPEKALPLFDGKLKPYLVDEATGAAFAVPEPPKVGALRSTRPPQAGRNYAIVFANPGQFVKRGNKVSIVIGGFKAEHLVVE